MTRTSRATGTGQSANWLVLPVIALLAGAAGVEAQATIAWQEIGSVASPAAVPTAIEADPRVVGMDPAVLARIDAVIDSALADGAAPGASLAIGRNGRIVRLRGYGTLDGAGSPGASAETIWDLASLTKVIGTTTAVMRLIDEGRLSLTDRAVDYLPWWSSGDPRKESVTVEQLLLHRAGLPAFRRWFLEMEGRPAYRRAMANEALEREPGTSTVYSDIGVMTLALIIEEITGQRLDAYLEEVLFAPLGMEDTGFLPARSSLRRIAPTEVDTLRGGKLHGVVHDENADAFGGVAGHAGLFSSARDLAAFAQMMLDGGMQRACDPGDVGATCRRRVSTEARLINQETVSLFTHRFDESATRAYGWDTPSDRSSAGDYFSLSAFGHTGYTGTSIWLDPESDLFVVFLTNRVNPTRENSRHTPLRRLVHDLAATAIIDVPVAPRPGSPASSGMGNRP